MYYDLVSRMHRDGGVTISTIAVGREANLAAARIDQQSTAAAVSIRPTAPRICRELFRRGRAPARGGDTTMVEKDFVPYTVSPDPVLKELAGRQLPALKGFVATDLKPGASLSVFVNSDGVRAPVVASWKFGAGKALAVTTDASGRWSSGWIENGVFGPLWDKLVAWMTPQTTTAQKFDVALGYRAGRIIRLTDYSDTARLGTAARRGGADARRLDSEAILSPERQANSGSLEAANPGNYYIQIRPRTAAMT